MALSALITLVGIGVVVVQVVRTYSHHFLSVEGTNLGNELLQYQKALSTRTSSTPLTQFTKSYLETHTFGLGENVFMTVEGRTFSTTRSKQFLSNSQARGLLFTPLHSSTFQQLTVGGTPYLALASPLIEGGGRVGAYVDFADISSLSTEESQVLLLTAAEGGISLLFVVLTGYALLRRVMRAVGEVTETALQIAEGDLSQRLPVTSSDDELDDLAGAFNLMISRISKTLEGERQLLADVSHQLRTPLTVLRGNVEMLLVAPPTSLEDLAETTAVLLDEIEYMTALADRLLYLERLSLPDYLEIETVDLRAFLGDLFEAAKAIGPRDWHLVEVPDRVLMANQASLRGALLNLLDNAFKATERNDVIELGVTILPKSEISLWVRDEGRGIPDGMVDKVFRRFETTGKITSRGAGLGLAIVKATAVAHGGRVAVSSVEGAGSTFEILLPLQQKGRFLDLRDLDASDFAESRG